MRHKAMACGFTPYHVKSALLTWFPTEASYTTSAVIFFECFSYLVDVTVSKVRHGSHYIGK